MLDSYHSQYLSSKFKNILQILIINKLAKLSYIVARYSKFAFYKVLKKDQLASANHFLSASRVPQSSKYVPNTVCQKNIVSPSEKTV